MSSDLLSRSSAFSCFPALVPISIIWLLKVHFAATVIPNTFILSVGCTTKWNGFHDDCHGLHGRCWILLQWIPWLSCWRPLHYSLDLPPALLRQLRLANDRCEQFPRSFWCHFPGSISLRISPSFHSSSNTILISQIFPHVFFQSQQNEQYHHGNSPKQPLSLVRPTGLKCHLWIWTAKSTSRHFIKKCHVYNHSG